MGLRTVLKTAGHWLKGLILKVDREIQFDQTINPEIDSTGGSFIWKTQTNNATSWKLRDDTTSEDILLISTSSADKKITVNPNYSTEGFGDIPQIKNSSYNFLAYGNSALTAGLNQSSTKFKGIPFPIKGNVDTTGIVFQVQNTSTATLHLALYKYDYDNDIWNKATEQLDINIAATGVISQNYTTPQALSPGLYCVAFRDSNSTGQLTGLFKHRSTNKFSGDFTDMTGFYNLMESATISYSPTMPAQITFPSANFIENNYHEFFQIKF